jgi:hypothetical protein
MVINRMALTESENRFVICIEKDTSSCETSSLCLILDPLKRCLPRYIELRGRHLQTLLPSTLRRNLEHLRILSSLIAFDVLWKSLSLVRYVVQDGSHDSTFLVVLSLSSSNRYSTAMIL